MTDIISLIINIAVLVLAITLVIFVYKRSVMLAKIFSLKKTCGAKITLHTFPFRPMWWRTNGPDISVEILGTVYRIHLYSGGGGTKYVHFADERFSVVYSKWKTMSRSPRGALGMPGTLSMTMSVKGKVNVISKLKVDNDEFSNVVNVLLFCPAPAEVSYVTEEKNTVKLAFSGDVMYGYKIFTPSTLVTHLDREYRRLTESGASSKASTSSYYDF